MATIQHLEKLRHLQRLFSVEESLEAAVACERLANLCTRTEQLIKQRTFLREERRRLRIGAERIAEREGALRIIRRNDWIPASIRGEEPAATPGSAAAGAAPSAAIAPATTTSSSQHARNIRINIGGLMFEAPQHILKRDPKSLLAQLCNPDPPVLEDPDGFFYFDRDWWLFRYVLVFLRDGLLPADRNLLAQLYREAAFWHLEELQHAIEEQKLHLRVAPEDKEKMKQWWRKTPSWLQAVDEAARKEEGESRDKQKKADWWRDTTYQGKTFLPLSTGADKLVTKPGEKDVKQTPQSTWSAKARRDDADDEASAYGHGYGYGYESNENSDYRQYNVRSSPEGGARGSRMYRPYFSSGGPSAVPSEEAFVAATRGFTPSEERQLVDSAAFTEKISRELDELTKSIAKKK